MTRESQQEINNLVAERRGLESERLECKRVSKEKDVQATKLSKRISQVGGRIAALKGKDIDLSEHAVLRFMERAMGFDIEEIRNRILDETTRKAINAAGDGKYPITDGYIAVVRNRTIITINEPKN